MKPDSVQYRQAAAGVAAQWSAGPPPPFDFGRSLDRLEEAEARWWAKESLRLEELGVLRRVPPASLRYVSPVFAVPKKKPGEFRLVVDLRHLNTFARKGTAEVETLRRLSAIAQPRDFAVALDLSDGYYHLRVRRRDAKYFQFRTRDAAYEVTALNMGWTRSPGAFTTQLQPVVEELRRRGVRLLWYLDDFLLLHQNEEQLRAARDASVTLFRRLGLKVNEDKCVWEPTRRLEHLGLELDLNSGVFRVGPRKVAKLATQARQLLAESASNCRRVRKRTLAELVGLAQFCAPAVLPTRLFLRELHDRLASTQGWSGRVRLSRQAHRDLRFWRDLGTTQASYNGGPIWTPVASVVMSTDASPFGWGATIQAPEYAEARDFWSSTERQEHINLLELRAVRRGIECFVVQLARRAVRLLCDNAVVVSVINNGTSRSPALMAEQRELWRLADRHRITLQVEWLPSAENVDADRLSRIRDVDDWRLTTTWFRAMGGDRCTIDRFASSNNARLRRFNSFWRSPGTEGVDAFAQPAASWRRERNWCNPPWGQLERLARHLATTGAEAVVVAPAWRHTIWHQLYRAMSDRVDTIPRQPGIFAPGRPVPADRLRAPRWDVDVFHVPKRAPAREFHLEFPALGALMA